MHAKEHQDQSFVSYMNTERALLSRKGNENLRIDGQVSLSHQLSWVAELRTARSDFALQVCESRRELKWLGAHGGA